MNGTKKWDGLRKDSGWAWGPNGIVVRPGEAKERLEIGSLVPGLKEAGDGTLAEAWFDGGGEKFLG
jgi:uncharacterized protein YidB (DUF937 family)